MTAAPVKPPLGNFSNTERKWREAVTRALQEFIDWRDTTENLLTTGSGTFGSLTVNGDITIKSGQRIYLDGL